MTRSRSVPRESAAPTIATHQRFLLRLSPSSQQLLVILVEIVGILRSRARTFVVIGWLLFVASIPICLSVVVGTAINLTYFAASPQVPFDAFDNNASWIFLASVAFAAVASSIALALRFRATASVLVILIWTTAIASSQVARSFVKARTGLFRTAYRPGGFPGTLAVCGYPPWISSARKAK
jgi:hypothetical protein